MSACEASARAAQTPSVDPRLAMISRGTATADLPARSKQRNLWAAGMSMGELRTVTLDDALAYLDFLAGSKPRAAFSPRRTA